VVENTPAAEAGLQAGDVVRSINGTPITSMEQLQQIIQENRGKPVQIEYERDGQEGTLSLTPRNIPSDQGPVGIVMDYEREPISWVEAVPRGVSATYEYGKSILLLPMRLLQGQASPEEGRLIGFKGMYDVYQQIQDPLWVFMAITMSLGIFNQLPSPALDGGRIALTLPEIFLRRRIPPQYENIIHLVGFAVLLIFLFYNLQDFINQSSFLDSLTQRLSGSAAIERRPLEKGPDMAKEPNSQRPEDSGRARRRRFLSRKLWRPSRSRRCWRRCWMWTNPFVPATCTAFRTWTRRN
jgi:regulator of sigma E protease